jgi:hypothetical protein
VLKALMKNGNVATDLKDGFGLIQTLYGQSIMCTKSKLNPHGPNFGPNEK